jgi:hypothetical protein
LLLFDDHDKSATWLADHLAGNLIAGGDEPVFGAC